MVTHVPFQQAGNQETLTAALTHMRTISGVPALVVGQFEGRWEAFVALLAGERHLARVALHVSFEVGGLCESLIADVTVEGLLTRVGEHVFCQTLQFDKALATLATDKRTCCAVGLQVVVEESLCAETFVAGGAHERLLSSVNALMVYQFRLIWKALITYSAGVSV